MDLSNILRIVLGGVGGGATAYGSQKEKERLAAVESAKRTEEMQKLLVGILGKGIMDAKAQVGEVPTANDLSGISPIFGVSLAGEDQPSKIRTKNPKIRQKTVKHYNKVTGRFE